jgi:hypothetical protein
MEREIFEAWISQIQTVRRSIPNYSYMIRDSRTCLLTREQQCKLINELSGLAEDMDTIREFIAKGRSADMNEDA